MTQEHPINPPPELVREWATTNGTSYEDLSALCQNIATQAVQWGADQELEACCEWLRSKDILEPAIDALRADRRPKPPSLKEQALALVEQHEDGWRPSPKDWDTIRRALEALPDSIVVFPSQC
jgi:uncharacterized protein involved in exopolysaccharide biosynthesis